MPQETWFYGVLNTDPLQVSHTYTIVMACGDCSFTVTSKLVAVEELLENIDNIVASKALSRCPTTINGTSNPQDLSILPSEPQKKDSSRLLGLSEGTLGPWLIPRRKSGQ